MVDQPNPGPDEERRYPDWVYWDPADTDGHHPAVVSWDLENSDPIADFKAFMEKFADVFKTAYVSFARGFGKNNMQGYHVNVVARDEMGTFSPFAFETKAIDPSEVTVTDTRPKPKVHGNRQGPTFDKRGRRRF